MVELELAVPTLRAQSEVRGEESGARDCFASGTMVRKLQAAELCAIFCPNAGVAEKNRPPWVSILDKARFRRRQATAAQRNGCAATGRSVGL